MIQRKSFPLSYYVRQIEEGAPFAFSRWGDGEFAAVLGYWGQNCDRHEYFPALGQDLRRALVSGHSYIYALGSLATKGALGAEVEQYLDEAGVVIDWHKTDVFAEALIAGELQPLVEALSRLRVHYVGPPHLFNGKPGTVAGVFPWQSITVIPERNCYLSKESIRRSILNALTKKRVDVIGFSAGMTSNVLIDELWPEIGGDVAMVDFGSLWDGYAGRMSRSYHRKVKYDTVTR